MKTLNDRKQSTKIAKERGEALRQRAARANVSKALGILKRAGVSKPPMKGDELPEPWRRRR